ncbi:hypothetical protein N7467_003063, partial [Penicillium canescens]
GGGISFVYEVHPRIVVKVPKPREFKREQFYKEVEIYRIFSQNPPCPSIMQCFLFSDSSIFLEYIRAVAFLESLNLAYGNLRPKNVLLNRNRLKLSDFDSTAKIGANYEACIAPQTKENVKLSAFLALGQNKIDVSLKILTSIVLESWSYFRHNKYVTVLELAAHTNMVLDERINATGNNGSRRKESNEVATPWRLLLLRFNGELTKSERSSGNNHHDVDHNRLGEEFISKKEFC